MYLISKVDLKMQNLQNYRIDGINKITISQYKYNTLRITFSHDFDLNTYYVINRKSILIKLKASKYKKSQICDKEAKTKNNLPLT